MARSIEYRKDIQVLRGIAVGLVVLFHLGVGGFDGGFLGVDVFFVISGYLMALLYDADSKLEFFTRRGRRILPSYFVVAVLTEVVATFLTVPSDSRQVFTQSLTASLFVPNIWFWAENSYFDKAAFKPLLHLWSLGVEIQFYLLVPVIAWCTSRLRIALPVLLTLSAMLCFVVAGVSPKTSFFWTPLRLWEFLIGFAVAKRGCNGNSGRALPWLGFVCLLSVICIPFSKVDGRTLGFIDGHPGLVALLIACASGVTIALGIPKIIERSWPSSVLAKLGDNSYSIYLAHFPIIVLFLYQPFAGTITGASGLGQLLILTTLVLAGAFLLHVCVENPGRGLSTRGLLRLCAVGICLVIAVGQLADAAQRLVTPHNEMLIYDAWNDRAAYRCGKLQRVVHPFAASCEITQPIATPLHRVLLVGNSHADSIKTSFASVAQSRDTSVYFMVENEPLMPGSRITPEAVIEEAISRRADAIVLHYSPGALQVATIADLAQLADQKRIRLDLIMPVPVWDVQIPAALIQHITAGKPLPSRSVEDYRKLNHPLMDGIQKIPGVRAYGTADIFCTPECILVSPEGRPLYFDADHLTLSGSRMLRGVFERIIADL